MAEITYKNSDFVLGEADNSAEVTDVVNKYETFLAAHCAGDYAFQRDAVKHVLRFFFSKTYRNIGELASANYQKNDKLQRKFSRRADYRQPYLYPGRGV